MVGLKKPLVVRELIVLRCGENPGAFLLVMETGFCTVSLSFSGKFQSLTTSLCFFVFLTAN